MSNHDDMYPGNEFSSYKNNGKVKEGRGNFQSHGFEDNGVPNAAFSRHSTGNTPQPAPALICRQFWKAGGDYKAGQQKALRASVPNECNHLRVHPMFLHSNATSHKWVFGAIAELLDNAVDEMRNGATYVDIDKTTNPRDGTPALLIKDDGGGMDPEALRHCMGFGFSNKTKHTFGQYGNGFKTSTMRIGADVIVCTRNVNTRTLTQSVGLLSYTYLRGMGYDRIVVPMVDYEFDTSVSSPPLPSYSPPTPIPMTA